MHLNSELLFKKHAAAVFKSGMRVLEIGPNAFPSTYQEIAGADATWETIDLVKRPGLTHVSSGEYEFPLPSDAFDVVLSAQVIEHVRKIWLWIKELARVCKPGGWVITINPVSWPYHEDPIDCWRIYPDGMRALYDEAGLTVNTSVCEFLAEHPMAPQLHCLKQFVKPWFGKKRFSCARIEATDTITIGRKPA